MGVGYHVLGPQGIRGGDMTDILNKRKAKFFFVSIGHLYVMHIYCCIETHLLLDCIIFGG